MKNKPYIANIGTTSVLKKWDRRNSKYMFTEYDTRLKLKLWNLKTKTNVITTMLNLNK